MARRTVSPEYQRHLLDVVKAMALTRRIVTEEQGKRTIRNRRFDLKACDGDRVPPERWFFRETVSET